MSNAYRVVRQFEKDMAEYTGAPYAVAVESCSMALFFCYLRMGVREYEYIYIPKYTYPSVANGIINAGGRINFDYDYSSWQQFGYYNITGQRGNAKITMCVDSAKFIARNMYSRLFRGLYVCLSFHSKKCLPIGRGGMILCQREQDAEWFKRMRFDGRNEKPLHDDKLVLPGWNAYMSPEQAARGLELMQFLKDENRGEIDPYNDLSQYEFYTEVNNALA